MSLRPAPLTLDAPRAAARVGRVAELLDCDESQVRRLVREGALEAHIVGKRGIRIYLDSVCTYQERGRVRPQRGAQTGVGQPRRPPRSAAGTAAHKAAIAHLKAMRLL